MSMDTETASFALAVAGWALFAPALLLAWHSVRQRFLRPGIVEHAWLGGAVLAALLWMVQIRVGGGSAFGMLGSGLYALVFGYSRGLLGLALALVLHTALAGGAWLDLGLNGVLLALVPCAVANALRRLIERRLPHNPFVFMIGNGMFSTLAATALTRFALIAASLLDAPLQPHVALGTYVGATLLLAWSEAIVSGMLLSALVVFRPDVVLTYREELYARRRS
jgi:uncharacterized membrane protein